MKEAIVAYGLYLHEAVAMMGLNEPAKLIEAGAVEVDGNKILDPAYSLTPSLEENKEATVKVGNNLLNVKLKR